MNPSQDKLNSHLLWPLWRWFITGLSAMAPLLSAYLGAIALPVAALMIAAQTMSTANGTITSPEIATLEGDQSQGGCIVVAPSSGRGGFGCRGGATSGEINKSVGRFPDGADTDSNCTDFLVQTDTTLLIDSITGSDNIKIASVAEFGVGQTILIDAGTNRETAVISAVGTPGASTVSASTEAGVTVIPVVDAVGFSIGQTISIDSGTNRETSVIAFIASNRRGRSVGIPGGVRGTGETTISVAAPLTIAHAAGAQVSGSGITLTTGLTRAHVSGAQICSSMPTPGAHNRYSRKAQR